MLKLYHGPTSVCSQKVRVTLAEIGLEYEGKLLDLQKGDQFDPEYLKLNPAAVVPTLVDGDLVLVESSLIAEYLDKQYNNGALMPDDVALQARTRHWLVRSMAIHVAINSLSFSTAMRDRVKATNMPEEIDAALSRMPDPVAREKRRDLYEQGLGSHHVEQALNILQSTFQDMTSQIGNGDWLSGPQFSLADIAVVPYIDRIERLGFLGLWEERFPKVGAWLSRMRERESYGPSFTDYIPEEAEKKQRGEGEKYWPQLSARWTHRLTEGNQASPERE